MSDRACASSFIDFVFTHAPGAPESTFVEVENEDGASVRIGRWVDRQDGFWVLRITADEAAAALDGKGGG